MKCKHSTNTNTCFRNLSTSISIICINYLVMCSKFYSFWQGYTNGSKSIAIIGEVFFALFAKDLVDNQVDE